MAIESDVKPTGQRAGARTANESQPRRSTATVDSIKTGQHARGEEDDHVRRGEAG